MTDSQLELTFKIGAQVTALEQVIQTVISLQLASQMKDEKGLTRAAELARSVRDHLLARVKTFSDTAPPETHASGVAKVMYETMAETIDRCFEVPAAQLDEIAKLVLAARKPPTDATH